MALSYEEGMATLRSIFPSWDAEVLAQLLEANEGHLENTIDMALTMEPPGAASTSPEVAAARTPPPPPASTPARTQVHTPQSRQQSLSPRVKQRASRVKLPDDFLRLPGGGDDGGRDRAMTEQERQDAQLAQMMQDEIFREQLFADEEFSAHFQGQRGRRESESRRSSITGGSREKTATEIANETFTAMSAKFSIMSEAMKKKANEMYVKFQNRDAPAKEDPYSHRPLMAGDSSDEEDDGHDARGSMSGDMRHRYAQDAAPAARNSGAFSPRARSSLTSRRSNTGTNKKDD